MTLKYDLNQNVNPVAHTITCHFLTGWHVLSQGTIEEFRVTQQVDWFALSTYVRSLLKYDLNFRRTQTARAHELISVVHL